MVSPSKIDPSASPAAFYGFELRRLREKANLSQQTLGERVFVSGAYIGQLENAARRPQLDLSRLLDRELATDGHLERLHPLLRHPRMADYFVEVVEHEARARTISEYAALVVPGLVQTRDYAEAIFLGAQPLLTEAELADRVAARLGRQGIVEDPTGPVLWMVLDEAVLHRVVSSRQVMAEQLRHIVRLITERQIIVQVVQFDAGAHAMLEGMISLMTFEDAPPLVYAEGPHIGQLIDETALVAKCRQSYDLVRAAALSPEASLARIKSAVEEHEHASDPQ
ncbi:helix-turn-helix transcriptional regulator [Kitasatospora sp. CB02891]|uniref:helix-turn-helix domain-containing protein n=1 Tax=Kitasatospora sp. CB02891 TaxID=2020329 RepID=UPI000C27C2F3|nr:helix-turn-helix transcriptional regulator [Kitasatospora sp. CB02891]PJN24944.1 transcriptional regulator [Kitasatospora sp. CB02891]